MKEEKSGGVVGKEGECGDDVVGLLERDRRRFDILSVKKKAKLSAREIPGVQEGKGEEDLRCKRLFTVCQGAWVCQTMTRLGWSKSVITRAALAMRVY